MLSQALKNKWMLVAKTLPFVIAALLIRFVISNVLHVNLTLKFAELAPVLTGIALILGLMLTGVLADYREAEKLPAVVARSLNDLDGLSRRGLSRIGQDAKWAHERVLALTETVNDWFYGRVSSDEMWVAHSDMGELILDLHKEGVPDLYLHRLMRVNSDGGGALSRIEVIRNTDFISAGYALMELLVAGVVMSLTVVQFPSSTIGYSICAALTLIYTYLVLLTKDVDNPFGHGDRDGKGSAVDVDLAPFHRTLHKLRSAKVLRAEINS